MKIKAGKKQEEKSSAKKEEGPVILSDLENGMYSSYQEFIKMHSGLLKQDQPEYIRQNMQTIIQAFRNGIKQDEFTTDVDGQILEAFKFMMQRFNDWPEFNRRRVLLHELAKDLTNIQLAIRSRLKGMPKSNYIEDQISKLKKAS